VPAREGFAATLYAARRCATLCAEPEAVGLLLDPAHAAELTIKGEDAAHGLGLGRVDDERAFVRVVAERHVAAHPHALLLRGCDLVADPFAGGQTLPKIVVSFAAGLLVLFVWIADSLPRFLASPDTAPAASSATRSAPTQSPSAVEFVKNQQLRLEPFASSNQNEWWDAISYHAEYVATGKHLMAYLEYQSADFGVIVKPNRVHLGDFHDFIRNGDLKLSVMMREARPDGQCNFAWGADLTKDKMLFVGDNRARIVFVDDNGREQRYYFLITGGTTLNTSIPGGKLIPYPGFVAGENLGFPAQWEAYDAQR
jgi:hypothetical protein